MPPRWQTHPAPVLDSWEDLIKEKYRRKEVEQSRISDVAMWLSRFEIMVRWVQSEIVSFFRFPSLLTSWTRREFILLTRDHTTIHQILTLRNSNQTRLTPAALFSRFVKLAYKSYELNDFLYVLPLSSFSPS